MLVINVTITTQQISLVAILIIMDNIETEDTGTVTVYMEIFAV